MPDPGTWLQARTKFMHTTAAWSIAGHIVGLGDRHCENLLIDYKSGANVQIDFGHLFDSGFQLPCPEIVPFRLTQNIVDSFGITGVEGGFRITCEAGANLPFPLSVFAGQLRSCLTTPLSVHPFGHLIQLSELALAMRVLVGTCRCCKRCRCNGKRLTHWSARTAWEVTWQAHSSAAVQ